MSNNFNYLKNSFVLSLILVLVGLSCDKKANCPDMSYQLWLHFGNQAGQDIEITLYPKNEFLWNDYSYNPGSVGGGHKDAKFIIEYDSLRSWNERNRIFFTLDTAINPSDLLRKVFDSILIELNNADSTLLFFHHEQAVNYLENPFITDSIWNYDKYEDHFPTNDCENKTVINDYTYYFEQDLIEG